MHTFNCNVTCEGIYADIQWMKESMDEMREGEQGNKQMKSKSGKVKDEMKLAKLIFEYKNFKKNFAHHFRFNSAAGTTYFGEFHSNLC